MALFGDDDLTRRLDLVRSTGPTPARSVTPADGVAVEGTVRLHQGAADLVLSGAEVTTLDPGDTDRPAADGGPDAEPARGDRPGADGNAAATRDRTLETTPGSGERGPPVLVAYTRRERDSPAVVERSLSTVPFVVEDDTGRVLVDATDLGDDAPGVLLSAGNTEHYLGTERGDRLVRTSGSSFEQVARAREALGTTPEYEHERAVLRAGDHVYVHGTAREAADGSSAVVGVPDDPGAFVLSDLSRSALAEQLDRASGGLDRQFWLFAVVGAIAAVILLTTVVVLLDSFVL